MARAKIIKGVGERNVTWSKDGEWRTDIFKSTLANPKLENACFILKIGQRVIILSEELRRVLVNGADHYGEKIWGPFNINPVSKTVNGVKVAMEVE